MAELDIENLLESVKKNGHDVWIAGTQTAEAVAKLENALQVRLPPSYRRFLMQYGGMQIHDSVIAGIVTVDPLEMGGGSVFAETTWCRQEHGLPDYLIVMEPDDEAPYCFDTRSARFDGEFSINCFELYSGADSKIAENFQQFLVEWYLKTWMVE